MKQIETYAYGGKEFMVPEIDISTGIIDFQPKLPTSVERTHPIVEAVHTTWDEEKFRTPRLPLPIDLVDDMPGFSLYRGLRILDMPIKLEGSDWRLPAVLKPYQETLETMAGYEYAINPHLEEYNAYVTIDQQPVAARSTQRNSGLHVDGFQGARIWPKNFINRSYIAYDCIAPSFWNMGFETSHLDPRIDNYFHDFDRQAATEQKRKVRLAAGQIVLMDAYTVHGSEPAKFDSARTFLRLSFDVLPFDRLGNTPNPLLKTGWDMVLRDAQASLR